MMTQRQHHETTNSPAAPARRLSGLDTVTRRHFLVLAATVAGGAVLSACGGATATLQAPTPGTGATTATTAGAAAPSTGATATVAGAPVSSPSVAGATVPKVNANTASQAELLQAFQAAGIPNAAQWVREVMEYRPYPTDDPTFSKLRGELAKYNPGPEVIDQIIAVLSLSRQP